jgi:2,4-didehydro-3-deoxy-L-rhamnonate hydrolase
MTGPSSPSSLRYALGTFSAAGSPPFPGLVLQDRVVALHALKTWGRRQGIELGDCATLLAVFDDWERNRTALTALVARLAAPDATRTLPFVDEKSLRVHAPLEQPRQFFCSGANYRKHVIDLIVDQANDPAIVGQPEAERRRYAEALMDERAQRGTPYIFSKAWSSIAGPFDPIPLADTVEQPDWELELAVVIGRPTFRVSRDHALDHVAGYTIVNDLTNRELVHRTDLKAIGTDWVMGKCLPGYAPMGPYILPAAFVPDPQNVRIVLKLNGQTMQDESTADMIFPVAHLIEYLSSRVQLWPGDILITGSPSGNGSHYNRFLQDGDILEGSIEGLGTQVTRCVAADSILS